MVLGRASELPGYPEPMTDETALPSDAALLWGLREAPRRGRKPSLTVEDITRAAVAVADAEGLGAVSMGRVAAELGNSTMALYRHVKSKDELLLLMADAALETPPELPSGGDWRSGLRSWALSVVATIREHPWAVHIPISGPPVGPRNLAWLDQGLGALADTGIPEGAKLGIVLGLSTLVQGQVRLSLDLDAGYVENPEAFSPKYSEVLTRVVDPRRMPALSRVIADGVFEEESSEGEDRTAFEFTLDLYLDGVAAFIARSAAVTS